MEARKAEIIEKLQSLYNNVHNKLITNTGKYEEVLDVDPEDGKLTSRIWDNYQTYLLSDKTPDGKARDKEELPLYTWLKPTKGTDDVNREGVYFYTKDDPESPVVPEFGKKKKATPEKTEDVPIKGKIDEDLVKLHLKENIAKSIVEGDLQDSKEGEDDYGFRKFTTLGKKTVKYHIAFDSEGKEMKVTKDNYDKSILIVGKESNADVGITQDDVDGLRGALKDGKIALEKKQKEEQAGEEVKNQEKNTVKTKVTWGKKEAKETPIEKKRKHQHFLKRFQLRRK